MSSQLVDMNADGIKDILVGSFSGVPFLIEGSEAGFKQPEQILDSSDQTVLIAAFWNDESNEWDETDRAESEGHCTSVAAVDWDQDNDLDLVLGDYYGGRLYLRLNEGDAKTQKFATTNSPIEAGGQPIVIPEGLAAPRIVDWNDDGKFDILCGGAKGGVYGFVNQGTKTKPQFAKAEVIIEPWVDETKSFIKRVPAFAGQPALPGSSFHIEAADYDNDGDLDLLVGARCSWEKQNVKTLSPDDKAELKRIESRVAELSKQISEMMQEAADDKERDEISKSEEYLELSDEYRDLFLARRKLDYEPTESGDFVWLFRRK